MVFLRDEGSVFDAPVEAVWAFLGDPEAHTRAHAHSEVSRERPSPETGTYAWLQPFEGASTRFRMRWHSYDPLGIAYEVLEGPFQGSRFFLFYTPLGARTAVSIVGEFLSPTLDDAHLPAAVERFFTQEFDQDRAALDARRRGAGRK